MSDHVGEEKKDSLSTTTAESPELAGDAHPNSTRPTHGNPHGATPPRSRAPPPPMAFFRLEQSSPHSLTSRIRNSNDIDPISSIHHQHRRSHSQLSSTSASFQPHSPWAASGSASATASLPEANNDLTTSLLPSSSQNSAQPVSITAPMFYSRLLRDPLQRIQQDYLTRENRLRFRRFIRRFGDYLASLSLLTMLVVVPIVLFRALSNRQLDRAAYRSARVMVVGTIVLSVRLVYLHLTHWYMPDVQKYIVRILWMVPIYSLQSYLSLRFHHARIYMSTVRDFYESYVIASFVYFLMELLGGQEALTELLRQKDPSLGQHSFPFNYFLEPWPLDTEFMLQCKHGVLQYVVFKTVATVVTFVCEFAGVYGEGRFSWFYAYPYLCFFQNISVMYALYCLVIFFHAVNEDLRDPVDWHPLGKFLCVKGVVFFTWWQGVVIYYLRDHGVIDKMGSWSSYDVANGLIDYCIVVEMVGFAIAHSYSFTYKEYLPGSLPRAEGNSANLAGSDDPEVSDVSVVLTRSQSSTYRPPATLHQPMKFKDAFWSSTVPKETLEDIQRLRTGMLNQTLERRRSFSLSEINAAEHDHGGGDASETNDPLVPPPADDRLARAQTMQF